MKMGIFSTVFLSNVIQTPDADLTAGKILITSTGPARRPPAPQTLRHTGPRTERGSPSLWHTRTPCVGLAGCLAHPSSGETLGRMLTCSVPQFPYFRMWSLPLKGSSKDEESWHR